MRNASRSGRMDPRDVPSYALPEAAHYLRIPEATLRSWFVGRPYPTGEGRAFFQPLFPPAQRAPLSLSFMNLLEAHVLDAIRTSHEVPMHKVRRALAYLQKTLPSPHPLVDHRFETDGMGLFIERYGELVGVAEEGQLHMKELLKHHLSRIEWGPGKLPLRLNLFTRKRHPDEPQTVVIDPAVSFGRPVLKGTGIPTAIIADRFKAGESEEALAKDYGRTLSEIREAIRCELPLAAA